MTDYNIRLPQQLGVEDEFVVEPYAVEDVEYDDTMTEERVARIVDGVHDSPSYRRARAKARLRRRGRPALDEHGTGRVSARVTHDQRIALERVAEAEGVPVSQLIRDALDEYLTHHHAS